MSKPNVDLTYLSNLSLSEHAREIFCYVLENPDNAWPSQIYRDLGYPKVTIDRYLKLMEKSKILRFQPTRKARPEKMKMGKKEITRLIPRWELMYSVDETPEAREFRNLLKNQNRK